MQVNLELLDKSPFFICPFSVKEDMKAKNKQRNFKISDTWYSREGNCQDTPALAMSIPYKNSDIPRTGANFRYLNKRLVQLNMSFPLVKECIQTIGASQCEVMSVIDLRDAYHTLCLAPDLQQYCGITPILWKW